MKNSWIVTGVLCALLAALGCSKSACEKANGWTQRCSSTCQACLLSAVGGACASSSQAALNAGTAGERAALTACRTSCGSTTVCTSQSNCTCIDNCLSQAPEALRTATDNSSACLIDTCESACQ